MDPTYIILTFGGFALIMGLSFAAIIAFCYHRPAPEEALIRTGMRGLMVTTGRGMVVLPFVHSVQRMDLSVKRIDIAREGENGLICRDDIRADVRIAFYVRVNNHSEDIYSVVSTVRPDRAADPDQLRELFHAMFSQGLMVVARDFDYVTIHDEMKRFRDGILQEIGSEMNGYCLDNCHIEYLEQTPVDQLNPDKILDAKGIEKLTGGTN